MTPKIVAESLELRRLMASITSVTPVNGQQKIDPAANVTVTFGSAMNASTLTAANLLLKSATGAVVPAAISYNATTRIATVDPTANLPISNSYYSLAVLGGASGVKDSGGGTLASTLTFSFTTGTPQFTETTVFSNLLGPTNIDFAADGRVFVAEKRGVIKVFDSLTDTTPDIFADFRTDVHNFWDRGLLGMTLDPKFTTGRPYVYALFTYDGDIGGTSPKWGTADTDSDPGGSSPTGTGVTASCRLVKFTASGNTMVNAQVLVADWPGQFPSHSIGDLRFGPDGYLYASGGDGASFNYADYGQTGNPFNDPVNEGGALRVQDVLSPNDPTTLNGAIIRIDPDTGLGAPGNPLTGDANRSRIIAWGLRNPFRLAFRPGTSELWIDDTGWNTWEEINRITNVSDSVTENFGWPAYEGASPQTSYQNLNLPLLAPLYADPTKVVSPYFTYNHSKQIVAGSDEPTGASSRTGLAFYTGSTYPAAYNGALFFSDYSRKEIYVMYPGVDGLPDTKNIQLFPNTSTGAIDLRAGPNGDLFYVDLNAGKIVRISANVNHSPTAVITTDKTNGGLPLAVAFSAANSTDPDIGETLAYSWDLNGDGVFGDSTLIAPGYTYTTAGPRTVQLMVTDSSGLSSVTSVRILAGNVAPVPVIAAPLSTLKWKVNDVINFSGSATDSEDGTLPASRLSWNIVLVYSSLTDPSSRQDRQIQQFSGVTGGSFIAPEWDYPAWIEVRMTATDSAGVATTTTTRIDPQITRLNVASNVTGVPITVDGLAYPTPSTKTVLTSGSITIAAPSTYFNVATGVTYQFSSWSDGGNISHQFTAPLTDTTYTATYVPVVAAPTGLTATPSTTGKTEVLLQWVDNSSNETSFIIDRSTKADFSLIDLSRTAVAGSTYYNDWGIQRGVTYYYRIRAVSGSLNSPYSNVVTAALAAGAAGTPVAPSGFQALATASANEAALSWVDNSTNETSFVIQRSTSATFSTIDLTRTDRPDSEQYVDWGLTAGTTYYYRLRAENGASVSAWTATVAFKPAAAATKPAAPTNLTVKPVTGDSSQLQLQWADPTALATYYVLQRSISAAFTTFTTLEDVSYYTGPFIDWGLTANTTYYYRVYGVNSVGQSANSAIVSGKTLA